MKSHVKHISVAYVPKNLWNGESQRILEQATRRKLEEVGMLRLRRPIAHWDQGKVFGYHGATPSLGLVVHTICGSLQDYFQFRPSLRESNTLLDLNIAVMGKQRYLWDDEELTRNGPLCYC
jgi:hypothetical protein